METVSTGVATAPSPVFYKEDNTKLTSRIDVNRELTRYIFSIGDHLEPSDKESHKSVGGKIGGIWVGHSEVEGAPTMKRTNYMMYRGGIIPIETTAVGRKADHREVDRRDENFLQGDGVPAGVRGYTIYAGDSLNYLQSDRFRRKGVVEITGLMGRPWSAGDAKQLQIHFFPDWTKWLAQEAPAPVYLDDWESTIREGSLRATTELESMTGAEMLESGRLFRVYAHAHIERNRQIIQSQRSTNTGGFFVNWNARSLLYAQQLKIQLEKEEEIRSATPAIDPAVVAGIQEDRDLRRQELEQNRQLIALLASKIGSGVEIPIEVSIPQSEETAPPLEAPEIVLEPKHDVAAFDTEIRCSETSSVSGAPCSISPKEGETMCHIHKAKYEKAVQVALQNEDGN